MVESPGEDYGYSAFLKEIDIVILGRRSFILGIELPYKDKLYSIIQN